MDGARHKRRVLGAVAAVAALVTGAAACSSSGGGSGSGATITMWTFKESHVAALQAAAAAFKAKTGITVKITAYTPDATFTSKVQSAAATHSVADVLEVHAGGEDFTFGGAGIVDDLASTMTGNWQSRFLSGTANTGLVTQAVYQKSLNPKSTWPGVKVGQLFSVPFTAGTFGIVYANKTKLEAAGINPSTPPATWEQLMSWMKATDTKDPQYGGVTLGLNVSSTGFDWLMEPLAYAELGKADYQALFGKNAAAAWGSPNGEKVLSLYNEISPYWAPGTQSLGIDNADSAFAQGKSAFDIGGTFTMASLTQDGMNPSNIVAFGVPASQGAVVSNLKQQAIALTGLSISSQSKNQAADLQWVNFLTTEAQAGAFAQTSYDLPAVDLGANAAKDVGPNLSSLESVFGVGANAFNPGDTTFMGPTWDITSAGNLVVQMTPLKEASPATTNAKLGTYNANTWK